MTDAPANGYDHVYVTVTKTACIERYCRATDSGWPKDDSPSTVTCSVLTNGVLRN